MIGAWKAGGPRERLYVSTTDTFDGERDLDFIAIEYALNGEPVTLTREEKVYSARVLDERGVGVREIARRVGADRATVAAWKDDGWGAGPVSRQARGPAKCGEPRMYRLHLARGEKCKECRAANAAADRRYRLTGTRKVTA